MNTRPFAAAGRQVSEVGLGCWQLGAEWGEVSDAAADAVLDAAVAAGISFFDTADVYGRGRSETRIGAFLRRSGARPFVATKVGRFPDPGMPRNFAFEVMRRQVLASRQRLCVEALDLVQLHCVPPEQLARGELFEHLRRLRGEGVLRHWGASVESVAEADRCLLQADCACLQIIFNVLRQTPAEALLDRAAERGVAIVVRLPLASGLLSGKLRRDTKFAADDHRSFNRDGAAFHVGETFAGLPFELALALVEELRGLLPQQLPMATASLRWILDHPAVTTIIPGATRPEQVRANAGASDVQPLAGELHQQLRAFWQQRVRPHVRGND